jgi:hypothetical protein
MKNASTGFYMRKPPAQAPGMPGAGENATLLQAVEAGLARRQPR